MTRPPRRLPRRLLIDLLAVASLAALALALRAWVLAIYAIPSASMMPTLIAGDYVAVDRWRFAWRRALPERGDVIIFHGKLEDYAKRVIGLPGERIALAGGRISIDGALVPRWRIADLMVPERPATPCLAVREGDECRYQRYREMLPGGRLVDTLDLGPRPNDDMAPVTVPAGHVFVLGDDRDKSADSRVSERDGGTGLVAIDSIVGAAGAILFSVDGTARLNSPSTWWPALRTDRMGPRF